MTTKEISREVVLTEIIAERDGMLLAQHQQIEALQREVEAMRAELEKSKAVKEA